jgi:hypothetical protein
MKPSSDVGIMTIASGDDVYIRMGATLGRSLRRSNPGVPIAVVSDRSHSVLDRIFDRVIPQDDAYGKGWLQKLHLDKYAPFERTMFIDADSLALRSVEKFFELLQDRPFAAVSRGDATAGRWYGDVAKICTRFDVPHMPRLNGGVYYFDRSETAQRIFALSREMIPEFDNPDSGLERLQGAVPDEPLVSLSMARSGVPTFEDHKKLMCCPMDCDWLRIDTLAGRAEFGRDGCVFAPAILHFNAGYWDYFHYRREAVKLAAADRMPGISPRTLTLALNAMLNTAYVGEVVCRRLIRALLRGQRFQTGNWIPVSRYQ